MENHYVPKFYTSRWASSDGKLFTYRRPFKSVIVERKFPAQVGFEEDLYTVPFLPDDVKFQLETVFFKRIDQEGSDVLAKIEKAGVQNLSQVKRFSWAIFVVALMQRHPIRVEHLARSIEKSVSNFIDNSREEYQKKQSTADIKSFEFFKAEALASEQIAQQKKMAIQSGILIPRTITWIGNATMAVATFASDYTLLTCDRPIMMSNGLGRPSGHIAFPIGPRKLFIAAQSSYVINEILHQPKFVVVLNDRIVRQAEEFVFGCDASHLKFVEHRLKHLQRPRLAGRAKKKRKRAAGNEA